MTGVAVPKIDVVPVAVYVVCMYNCTFCVLIRFEMMPDPLTAIEFVPVTTLVLVRKLDPKY